MVPGWMQYERENKPIPASYFPKSFTFDWGTDVLPDMFHTTRRLFVLSERARGIIEHWAPGQVEFIPVACHAAPNIAAQLQFDSAYYFINVLGRAQRLQWLEMPLRTYPPRDDGTELFGLLNDFNEWKLRERAAGEPLIWHDTPWSLGTDSTPIAVTSFSRIFSGKSSTRIFPIS